MFVFSCAPCNIQMMREPAGPCKTHIHTYNICIIYVGTQDWHTRTNISTADAYQSRSAQWPNHITRGNERITFCFDAVVVDVATAAVAL